MHSIKILFFISESRIQKLPDLAKVALLLLFPTICTIVVDLFWYYVLSNLLVAPKEDKDTVLAVLTGVSVLYGIVAGAALKRVWKEHETTQDLCCLVDEDRNQYVPRLVRIMERRIPLVTHMLLVVSSLAVLGLILICPFEARWVGLVLTSVATFIMTTGWAIAIELENPVSGYWIIKMSDQVKEKITQFRLERERAA